MFYYVPKIPASPLQEVEVSWIGEQLCRTIGVNGSYSGLSLIPTLVPYRRFPGWRKFIFHGLCYGKEIQVSGFRRSPRSWLLGLYALVLCGFPKDGVV